MPSQPTPLIVTGASGLVGGHFTHFYGSSYAIENLDLSNKEKPVDITKLSNVLEYFEHSQATAVVHLAAFTDVTKAWEESGDTTGLAYKINVTGTKNIITACERFNKHLIHISTAYVFDGDQNTPYTETDQPNPIEWYGKTKYEAECLVTASSIPWTILRIDQPFGSLSLKKPDVVRRIINNLEASTLPPQFTNHTFGPTFLDDFVRVIDWVVKTQTTGLFHATSGEEWSDYEFAKLVQHAFKLAGTILPGNLDTYLKTTKRPYQKNTALATRKLQKVIPFSLSSVEDALKKLASSN